MTNRFITCPLCGSDGDVLDMVREFKAGHPGYSRETTVGHLVGEGVSEMKSKLAVDFAAKDLPFG